MLHKVNLPACHIHLNWILQLQGILLNGLCKDTTTAHMVDEDWVRQELVPLSLDQNWIKTLCSRKNYKGTKQSLLTLMAQIAGLPSTMKQELQAAFEHDCRFSDDFEDKHRPVHQFRQLCFCPVSETIKKEITDFFLIFYEPLLGEGYAIPNLSYPFNRKHFHDDFLLANPKMEICPMCDGQRDLKAELDHFYPKAHFPYLACHPYNLTPICPNCNSTANKGPKIPLQLDETNPREDWFHPYLQPLMDWSDKSKFPSFLYFNIRFGGGLRLESCDTRVQKRLDNLEELVHFSENWKRQLKIRIRAVGRDIDRAYNRGRIKDRQELIEFLGDEADKMQDDLGESAYAIMMYYYYKAAAREQPEVFDELLKRFKTAQLSRTGT